MRVRQIIHSIPDVVWVVVLFALALTVRLVHLTDTDIAGDEPFSIFVAQFEPAFIIQYLSTGNNPPLFELFLHYWIKLIGDSDYQLRLLPTILSALTVVPIFMAAKKYYSLPIGFFASFLFIFSTWNIRFSHEVRVYPLLSFLTALSIWFFLSIVSDPSRKRNWVGIAFVWVLMLYSHYVSIYMIGAQTLIGMFQISKQNLNKAISLVVATVLAYLPQTFTLFQRVDAVVDDGGTWVQSPGLGESYGMINLMLNDRIVTVLFLLVLAGGIIVNRTSIWDKLREAQRSQMVITIVLLFTVPYLSQFFVSLAFVPMFTHRYILYTSVPLYLFVSWLVCNVWANSKLSLVGPIALLISVIGFGSLNPTNNREVSKAIKQVADLRNESTDVYVLPETFDLTFCYHFNRDWFSQKGSLDFPKSELSKAMNANQVFAFSYADEIPFRTSDRIVCLDAHAEFMHPNNGVLEKLSQQYTLKDSTHFHQIFDVYLFERK